MKFSVIIPAATLPRAFPAPLIDVPQPMVVRVADRARLGGASES